MSHLPIPLTLYGGDDCDAERPEKRFDERAFFD